MENTAENHAKKIAAHVLLPGIGQALTYEIPNKFNNLRIGAQVAVNLGKRTAKGWVVNILSPDETTEACNSHSLKPILEFTQTFCPDNLRLFNWISNYYGCSLFDVIENSIPKVTADQNIVFVEIAEKLNEEEIQTRLKRAPLQKKIITYLQETGKAVPLDELRGLSSSIRTPLNALEASSLVKLTKINTAHMQKKPSYDQVIFKPAELTNSQASAIKQISHAVNKNSFAAYLLYGVTGSGKTEVYLQSIQRALELGRSALVIVPEIALTPQIHDIFQSRLQSTVALLHSQVGDSLRWNTWKTILNGDIKVAIGARSAIFAPLKNLGLIIVDEEHENSYKQSEGFRYHARNIAVIRAKIENCPIVLGSATPSFESLHNVQLGRYQLLEMPDRATSRPLPKIEIVDISKLRKKHMASESLSPRLFEEIKHSLENSEQIVILYNRRGFSSYLQCNTCSEVLKCPNCSVSLTFHKTRNLLLCHLCDHRLTPPDKCPDCLNQHSSRVENNSNQEEIAKLVHRGGGTEKIFDELKDLFPEAKILRMDRDTVGKKGAYREILSQMKSGEADILVGTQMIAKGHDLPGVTLVGIVDADVGLHLPDFRSSENIFQLITQASGRAGRGEKSGRVIVQTREPNHPTILSIEQGRFKAFARYEMDYRKKLNYPPFTKLLRVIISGPDKPLAQDCSMNVRRLIDSWLDKIQGGDQAAVLGPAVAPYEKLRGRFRYHLFVKSPSSKLISTVTGSLYDFKKSLPKRANIRISLDVDPMDML